ncbi:hypothetical protein PHYBLDRAFT_61627 [Phycomyces blakesleeanus NRRL 1555(-)]|uniref:Uncharacterized protein n=1 Tax=Phycomyces blakesleeanus (strain ATCC 8743b / DSM 1359 / FGSC 10004 / NBRC 33097 / NRRL 1555) TaxID=763407 RepID=A0A162Q6Q9_PHYB8|nr:hypothetical protein PHYBLDRAFT_61627 [Phycomyces blakesleeanus NRRL 1555(-)]OAD80576.1 hypothetical protein PHYBLDRAFT_61627 [Phycomyces blakesleeanus NRRL 1555(-)]|eukprot:XP_018298616.1 hypothetical protein PHYBLDRAFT_61627 [Phycomyces blakesleeanus NRRL 1555(-)]
MQSIQYNTKESVIVCVSMNVFCISELRVLVKCYKVINICHYHGQHRHSKKRQRKTNPPKKKIESKVNETRTTSLVRRLYQQCNLDCLPNSYKVEYWKSLLCSVP